MSALSVSLSINYFELVECVKYKQGSADVRSSDESIRFKPDTYSSERETITRILWSFAQFFSPRESISLWMDLLIPIMIQTPKDMVLFHFNLIVVVIVSRIIYYLKKMRSKNVEIMAKLCYTKSM